MAGKKWYVVWSGLEPGVYDSWEECRQQIEGVKGARYKAFPSRSQAMQAFEDGAEGFYRRHYGSQEEAAPMSGKPIFAALAVDAACSGNPGVMEYRAVRVDTHQEIFHVGPLPEGTNNIGEFLAIVHALALLKQRNMEHLPIYSDSVTAISWVRNKRCKTLLQRTPKSAPVLDLVLRAEKWLHEHTYRNPIYKWDTPNWGEIPADFGRKG
ncbi:viroplasmin family protein [Porphyromonas sp. COT-239 OH1446]|uniref:ribonuclease H1 domain-containing protein n=1 Tax=Porphyromonas sp. COT-239 OH1446 TaxID=1515613 RepID=UPI00052DADFC|nr:ribonuclease H family protein [Porphyromonas sp. COT-239 OH1446]KGN72210.1 ribonuclease H [Porphyromonas sp. COT-239 OH1446]